MGSTRHRWEGWGGVEGVGSTRHRWEGWGGVEGVGSGEYTPHVGRVKVMRSRKS